MNKEFIPYEQALELKELGFDEPYYFATYLDSSNLIPREEEDGWDLSKGIIAPLYQQAFRWFREKYILIYVIVKAESWFFTINGCNTQEGFNTYEEAELACLRKLIEIVKEKQSSIPDENFDYVKPNAKTLPMLKKIYGDCATDKTATFQVLKKKIQGGDQ